MAELFSVHGNLWPRPVNKHTAADRAEQADLTAGHLQVLGIVATYPTCHAGRAPTAGPDLPVPPVPLCPARSGDSGSS